MLMIKTRIGPSKIKGAGLGLFADEFVAKDTVTWRFMPNLDLVVPEDTLLQISEPARAQFLNYCYVDKYTKHFILCFDDERFINHSKEPNIIQNKVASETEGVEIAVRDIQKGEELYCDYEEFDLDTYRKLHKLDIYAHMIEDEKEREREIENFIAKLFKVNAEAAKKAKNGQPITTADTKGFGAKIADKLLAPFRNRLK